MYIDLHIHTYNITYIYIYMCGVPPYGFQLFCP